MMGGVSSKPIHAPTKATTPARAPTAGPVPPKTNPQVGVSKTSPQATSPQPASTTMPVAQTEKGRIPAPAAVPESTNNFPDFIQEKMSLLQQERMALQNSFVGKANTTFREQEQLLEDKFQQQKQTLLVGFEQDRHMSQARHQSEMAEIQRKQEIALQHLEQYKIQQLCQLRVAVEQLTNFSFGSSFVGKPTHMNTNSNNNSNTNTLDFAGKQSYPGNTTDLTTFRPVAKQSQHNDYDDANRFIRDVEFEEWLSQTLRYPREQITATTLEDLIHDCIDKQIPYPRHLSLLHKTRQKHHDSLLKWETRSG